MDISKYSSYFHDGSLYEITHKENSVALMMSSAEMDPDDMQDKIPFSPDDTLKGKLYIDGVKNIQINKRPYQGTLKMEYDEGRIFGLTIDQNKIKIQIIWLRYNPKPVDEVDFSTIEIEGEQTYWEPIPDFMEPPW